MKIIEEDDIHPQTFIHSDGDRIDFSMATHSSLDVRTLAPSIAANWSAMPALLSSSRLPFLSVVSLACNPAFRAVSSTLQPLLPKRVKWMGQSEMLMIRRGLEASIAGVALVLIIANCHSSGWTNIFRVPTHSPRAAVSRVYSMAALDTTPSIVVYVTVPNKETGTRLAHSIIENKLAACVNQIPGVESTYWWEGKVETDTEILLMIKTRQSLLGELTDHVNTNHPYDTPEVIALPITGGSEKYLKWIGDNTKNAEEA